jgi:hypothetical protein
MTAAALKIERTPYTYILEWTKLGKRYIGARWGKGCHPGDLFTGYFTSSKYVHDFVATHGNPDLILIDQICSTPQEAISREEHLLRLYDAQRSDTFLNKSLSGCWSNHDPEILAKISATSRGRVVSLETRAKIGAANRGQKRSPAFSEMLSRLHTGRVVSEEARRNMSIAHKGRIMPEHEKLKRRGRKLTDEHRTKLRLAHRNRKWPKVSCLKCRKVGGINVMHIYHLENCGIKRTRSQETRQRIGLSRRAAFQSRSVA